MKENAVLNFIRISSQCKEQKKYVEKKGKTDL